MEGKGIGLTGCGCERYESSYEEKESLYARHFEIGSRAQEIWRWVREALDGRRGCEAAIPDTLATYDGEIHRWWLPCE